MSEQGRRAFLAAHGGAAWVVLHGGAFAVFRLPSLIAATRLAGALAEIPGFEGALITIADDQLAVRLTRGLEFIEDRHVELARQVSAAARAHGAVADRSRVQEVQLAV